MDLTQARAIFFHDSRELCDALEGALLDRARYPAGKETYNLLFRTFERDLLPLCAEEGLAVIPYNPLAGGLLTGKHDRAAPPAQGTRFTVGSASSFYTARYWHEREFDTVDALRTLAKEADMNLASMAVAWVLMNPTITSPIIGASRPEQLGDSLMAEERGPLTAALMAKLDEVTRSWRAVDAER